MGGTVGEYKPKEDLNVDITGPGYKANLRVFDNDGDWRLELMNLPFGAVKVEGINIYEYGEFLDGFASVVVPLVINKFTKDEWLPEIEYCDKKPLCFIETTYNRKEGEFYGRLEKATNALVSIDNQLSKAYNTKMKGLLEGYGFDQDFIEASFVRKVA